MGLALIIMKMAGQRTEQAAWIVLSTALMVESLWLLNIALPRGDVGGAVFGSLALAIGTQMNVIASRVYGRKKRHRLSRVWDALNRLRFRWLRGMFRRRPNDMFPPTTIIRSYE